jgi:hypothetical protein
VFEFNALLICEKSREIYRRPFAKEAVDYHDTWALARSSQVLTSLRIWPGIIGIANGARLQAPKSLTPEKKVDSLSARIYNPPALSANLKSFFTEATLSQPRLNPRTNKLKIATRNFMAFVLSLGMPHSPRNCAN